MKVPEVWVTVGKRGFSRENLLRLTKYPIAGIRINTGRSSIEWAGKTISCLIDLGYDPKQIMLDIGNQKPRLAIRNSDALHLAVGSTLKISKDAESSSVAILENDSFFDNIENHDRVYFGDGEMECVIVEKEENAVVLSSLSEGEISNNVAIGIVGKDFNHFFLSKDEIATIDNLLSVTPVSLILSFVENADHISLAKDIFPCAINIIPKIETTASVQNFKSIAELSEKVFIGRGDLGLSVGLEKIGVVQKRLIQQAHNLGKYVALGTGTLDSLKSGEVPLRAEIIDITNSCFEGVDAIVLTSETASSYNPFKSIDYLFKILNYMKEVSEEHIGE